MGSGTVHSNVAQLRLVAGDPTVALRAVEGLCRASGELADARRKQRQETTPADTPGHQSGRGCRFKPGSVNRRTSARVNGWILALTSVVFAPVLLGLQIGLVVLILLLVAALLGISMRSILKYFAASIVIQVTTSFGVSDRIEKTASTMGVHPRAVAKAKKERRPMTPAGLVLTAYQHGRRIGVVEQSLAGVVKVRNQHDILSEQCRSRARQQTITMPVTLALPLREAQRSAASRAGAQGGCDPSYPGVCIKPPPPDLDCSDIKQRRFEVKGSDPHRFDGDKDGVGCES